MRPEISQNHFVLEVTEFHTSAVHVLQIEIWRHSRAHLGI